MWFAGEGAGCSLSVRIDDDVGGGTGLLEELTPECPLCGVVLFGSPWPEGLLLE